MGQKVGGGGNFRDDEPLRSVVHGDVSTLGVIGTII